MSHQLAPSERRDAAVQIDFDGLHQQAATALNTLRQSHDRRTAITRTAAF